MCTTLRSNWYVTLAVSLGLVLAYGAYWTVGPTEHMAGVQLAVALLAITHSVLGYRRGGQRSWVSVAVIALLCYVAFQVFPLPQGVVRLLSPANGPLLDSLRPVAPGLRLTTISLLPAATLAHLMRLCTYLLIALLARDTVRHFEGMPWIASWPLLVIGGLEGLLGLAQFILGGAKVRARGTYYNADHYSGLLELCFPFAVLLIVASLQRPRSGGTSESGVLRASGGALAAGAMAAGILTAASRMGLIACAVGGLTAWGIALARAATAGRARLRLAGVIIGVLLLAALVAPATLVSRFGNLVTSDYQRDSRLPVWRSTLDLIRTYPVFGCGLGAYEPAFLRFKPTPLGDQTNAHNDYLQLAAELGGVGFLIAAVVPVCLVSSLVKVTRHSGKAAIRALATAGLWSILAILLHSLADFNLYIQSNAMVLAWIAGLAAGICRPGRLVPSRAVAGPRNVK